MVPVATAHLDGEGARGGRLGETQASELLDEQIQVGRGLLVVLRVVSCGGCIGLVWVRAVDVLRHTVPMGRERQRVVGRR